MAGDKPRYAPPAASVIGAYAAVLDELWDLPLELWRTVTEAAYAEQTDLKPRQTTVFIQTDGVTARTGDVIPGLQVSAERLGLDGEPATKVDEVKIESRNPAAATGGGQAVAEVTVRFNDKAARGAYRLTFDAPGWAQPEIRIVNFGV
jgi:hypothetical protein